ncbi:unnamed protein product, partial [Amoebophrya sp. A25]|eukprot:GSA25T00026895001.1
MQVKRSDIWIMLTRCQGEGIIAASDSVCDRLHGVNVVSFLEDDRFQDLAGTKAWKVEQDKKAQQAKNKEAEMAEQDKVLAGGGARYFAPGAGAGSRSNSAGANNIKAEDDLQYSSRVVRKRKGTSDGGDATTSKSTITVQHPSSTSSDTQDISTAEAQQELKTTTTPSPQMVAQRQLFAPRLPANRQLFAPPQRRRLQATRTVTANGRRYAVVNNRVGPAAPGTSRYATSMSGLSNSGFVRPNFGGSSSSHYIYQSPAGVHPFQHRAPEAIAQQSRNGPSAAVVEQILRG